MDMFGELSSYVGGGGGGYDQLPSHNRDRVVLD